MDLTWANLTGADLAGARLTNADLQGADVDGANLIGADLTGLHLTRSLVARLREQEDENKEDVKNYARALSLFVEPPLKEKGVDYIVSDLLCKDGGRQLKEFEKAQSLRAKECKARGE
ncbi:Pentapeptide repeats (8 copies) [Piscirickettsiaceae bacterium NZ-RLO1]|nr:Pentapeptide repeats (8 copies) [Piscirickettsiaceae bacterium NZ-RLO1]